MVLTAITTIAILWLTLAPKPLGDDPPSLFPGADKIVHAIMFGGFAAMLLLDWQRKHQWRNVSVKRALISACLASAFGILIEIAQFYMGLGRGFEFFDILADIAGAWFFSYIYIFFQKFWALTPHK